MHLGLEKTGENEVNNVGRVLFGKGLGRLFLREQPRRGARLKTDMLMWKEVEETQGHMNVTFSVK